MMLTEQQARAAFAAFAETVLEVLDADGHQVAAWNAHGAELVAVTVARLYTPRRTPLVEGPGSPLTARRDGSAVFGEPHVLVTGGRRTGPPTHDHL